MNEPIYHLPQEYDLEHATREADVDFYINLARRWQPTRILELGCGTGRVTIPLAAEATDRTEEIVGLDCVSEMLQAALDKSRTLARPQAHRLRWVEADLRYWQETRKFGLIIAPCGTLCHLLSLDDQLTAWRTAFLNLSPGGRFIADVPMAEFPVLAESMQTPRRAFLQIDTDTTQSSHRGEKRLIRYRAVTYRAADQCAFTHHLYDEFQEGGRPERFVSDYEHHVYYPRELELLFRLAGFVIEFVWGDHTELPLADRSHSLVMIGIKPASCRA